MTDIRIRWLVSWIRYTFVWERRGTVTAREIADLFESIAPLDSGVPGDELGFIYGDPSITIRGIGCLWSVDAGSIQHCIDHGLNLIICHERLWLPPQESPWYDAPPPDRLFSRIKRSALLDAGGITVYRSHSNWDALPVYGIADSAIGALGIENLQEIARRKFFTVQELPETLSAGNLLKTVESRFGASTTRFFGDREKKIQRFAFLIGGFGENQFHLPQVAMELGAEALIIGEMSEFIVLSCLEMGLPVIETLHSVSEIPGIRNQVKILAGQLPEIPVEYVPSGITAGC